MMTQKLCVDCKHFRTTSVVGAVTNMEQCARTEGIKIELVHGKNVVIWCSAERTAQSHGNNVCGPEGQFFESKET